MTGEDGGEPRTAKLRVFLRKKADSGEGGLQFAGENGSDGVSTVNRGTPDQG